MEKKELRKNILTIRDVRMTKEEHEYSDRLILEKVLGLLEELKPDAVCAYCSYRGEVSTEAIFQKYFGHIFAPKVLDASVPENKGQMIFWRVMGPEDIVPGYRGILEPDGIKIEEGLLESFDPGNCHNVAIIVPGVAFDRAGNRLGYGGGYYDRFLEKMKRQKGRDDFSCRIIALCYEEQMVENGVIPIEPTDVPMDMIITQNEIYTI